MCAAPIGNKFYLLRSKDGRDRLFENPEKLLEEIVKYFDEVKEKTIDKPELIKSGDFAGQQFNLSIDDFPTKPELAIFLGFAKWESFKNYKDYSVDFLEVITWAEETIANWKLKMAAANILNPNIIARDLGLSEKTQLSGDSENPVTLNHSHTITLPDGTKLDNFSIE